MSDMGLGRSLLFFGFLGLAILTMLYVAVPTAVQQGVPLIVAWAVGLWTPILFVLLLIIFRSQRAAPQESFVQRFRLQGPTKKEIGIALAAVLVVQALELTLSTSTHLIAKTFPFALPPILPELFTPGIDLDDGLKTFFGVPTLGNWWLILFWIGWLIVNIGGEELLWRGYALPRQERIFGRAAWLVNGLCWNLLVHMFMWWNYITLLPVSLVVPYLVQRTKKTWIGILVHGIGNLLVLVLLVPSIAGWL